MSLAELQWRAPEWIAALGGLRTDNVLEYFSKSPFYDRHSNNEVLRMQSQFNTLQATFNLLRDLQTMQGAEFVVAEEQPPHLWVIKKQLRSGPKEATVLNAYFVINENIYMAPNAYDIMVSRVLDLTLSLKKAMHRSFELSIRTPSAPKQNEANQGAYEGLMSQALYNSTRFGDDFLDNHTSR